VAGRPEGVAEGPHLILLVDTSVWIDFFRGREASHVTALEQALHAGDDVCVCGLILTEVLQGIRSDVDYRKTATYFKSLVFLPMSYPTFVRAAEIYRALRRDGVTVRRPMDCLIAATAIEHDALLLHNDRDFDPIEKHAGLRVLHAAGKSRRP
jgi:predicted nucleic acid-binding protein